MNVNEGSSSEDEFFDFPTEDKRNNAHIKFCAVASTRGMGRGRVFTDEAKAFSTLRDSKGSRLKIFADPIEACSFANTPVEELEKREIYPPSPKADSESTPFSSVSLKTIFSFRNCIEKADKCLMESIVNENPLILVSLNDTPILMQARFRYNALHVAAKSGATEIMQLILNYLNSSELWKRIYPQASDENSINRQLYVTDLYLNSPETGFLETPLHFASKYGHIDCVRLLVGHPLTQISPLNRSGETPADIAASRCPTKTNASVQTNSNRIESIKSVFQERYIILVDLQNPRTKLERFGVISSPLSIRQLQLILSRCGPKSCKTFTQVTSVTILPFDLILRIVSSPTYQILEHGDQPMILSDSSINLTPFGLAGEIIRLRAIVGPLSPEQATLFRNHWSLAKKTTCYTKTFSLVRLMDPEKGYERQGRYLSRVFRTHWFEYWDFLDDFIDLSTELGLVAFENYLCKLSSETNANVQSSNSNNRNGSISSEKPVASSSLFSETDMDTLPRTPITRQKFRIEPNNHKPSIDHDKWISFRPYKSTADVLEDSLEEDMSNNNLSSVQSTPESVSSPMLKAISSPISPVIKLLKHLTVVYPLRWVYPNSQSSTQQKTPNSEPRTNSSRSTKRRLSALSISNQDPDAIGQPEPKRFSPDKRPTIKPLKPELFRHYVHINRALPGGDNELLIRSEESQPDDAAFASIDQQHVHSIDIAKFPSCSEWRRQLELVMKHIHTTCLSDPR